MLFWKMAAASPTVAWILQNYPPCVLGGAEFSTHRLNVWLQKRGWTVTVYLVPGGLKRAHEYPAEFEGIKLVPCSAPHTLQLSPNVVVCSQLWATRYARMLVELRAVHHYMEWVHYVDATVIPRWPWTSAAGRLTMVYNSQDTKARAEALAGGWLTTPAIRTLVVPPVVWPIAGATPRLRADDYPWITLVNTSADKGIVQFNAMAAADCGTHGRVYTGVRGAHGAQCAVHDRVQCLEATLDMEPIWASTRILVVPSAYETWSMVATEAMAHGIPVVAADHIPALRENCGSAALYVPRDDTAAWLRAFATIEAGYAAWSAAALAQVRDPTERLTAAFSFAATDRYTL